VPWAAFHVVLLRQSRAAPAVSLAAVRFPFAKFLESLCRTSTAYLNTRDASPTHIDLVRNSLALAARLFRLPAFRTALSQVDSRLVLRVLSISAEQSPLFDPLGPFSDEAISFFYAALSSQPGLPDAIAKEGLSNSLLLNLTHAAQLAFERHGVCYVHSIIVAIVLLLVVHPTIATNLSAVCEQEVRGGSHADFLMNVLLSLTQQETFWP
jgi:hypothetical protein